MRPSPAPIHVPKDETLLRSEGDTKYFYKLLINGLMPYISHVLYCYPVLPKFPTIYTYNQQFPTLTRSEYFRVMERGQSLHEEITVWGLMCDLCSNKVSLHTLVLLF